VFLLWCLLCSLHCEHNGSNSCVAAVVSLPCDVVVLVYGCVVVFIVVSVVKRSF